MLVVRSLVWLQSLLTNALSNYTAMLEAALDINYIKSSDVETLKEWRKSPSTWTGNSAVDEE